MPKSTPGITIRVDAREVRSGIPDLLINTFGVSIEVAPLRAGDYELGGRPIRVAELKAAPDLVALIADQRLFAQVDALLTSGVAPVVVLEGDWRRVQSRMHPNAIRGALTYLAGVLQVPVLPSAGVADTAALPYSLAKQLQVVCHQPGAAPAKKAKTLTDQQISVLAALLVSILQVSAASWALVEPDADATAAP